MQQAEPLWPSLRTGDALILDRSRRAPSTGDVCVCEVNGETVLLRYRREARIGRYELGDGRNLGTLPAGVRVLGIVCELRRAGINI